MTDAEKVVKALRARCTCPRVAGMECGDCEKWDALAAYVVNAHAIVSARNRRDRSYIRTFYDATLARLVEVLK